MDGPGLAALRAPGLAAETSALSVERVSHSYGERRALEGVSLAVPRGGFVALLGLNGAGKTTLFSLITRLFDTRHGRITVQGFDVSRRPSAALAELGVVFQARTLDLDITVGDNLLYHAALHGIGRRRARERVAAVLEDVGLSDRAREKARRLSGGQMRRIEIARALVHEPSVLALDEPTVGLDVASKATIVEQVRALARARGVAVLWATHLLDEIEPGDQVVVLHLGKVLASGEMSAIIASAGAADLRSAFRALTGAAAPVPDAEEGGA
ncbi:MAG: ATP-binding cassette domain-containing protein [Rhodospirillales bacterium]|nr:ATP-binding cassette domain-containing protein [Rhodospirillales bacterium]